MVTGTILGCLALKTFNPLNTQRGSSKNTCFMRVFFCKYLYEITRKDSPLPRNEIKMIFSPIAQ